MTLEVASVTAEATVGQWASVEPLGPDRCRMTMDTDTLDWPVLVLASLDCELEVEGPAELATLLDRLGRRFVTAAARAG